MLAGRIALLDHGMGLRDEEVPLPPHGRMTNVKVLTFRERDTGLEVEVFFSAETWNGFQKWVAAQAGGVATASAADLSALVAGLPKMDVPKSRVRAPG